MKNIFIIAVIAYAGYYYFNKKQSLIICETVEDVRTKELEVAQAMITKKKKLKKRSNGTSKLQNIIRRLDLMQRRGYPYPQDACDAYNDLLGELQ